MSEAKKQLVQSWLIKAQHDLASAEVLSQSLLPLLDTAVYHCQQAAEKSVKGYLAFCDHEFERVHDVEALIRAATTYEPRFKQYEQSGRLLTPHSRIFRYPGVTLHPEDSQFDQAFIAASEVYEFVLSVLPIDVHPVPLQKRTG
jgi:HEPN domain-containing protein